MPKKIRAARHYQREDDPVLRLSRSAMRSVAKDLKDSFDSLTKMVDKEKVLHALKHGGDVKQTINWHHYRETLKAPFNRLGKLRAAGGDLAARKITAAHAKAGRAVRYRKSTLTPLDEAKATKEKARYRPGTAIEQCGICTMFFPSRSCTAVLGEIDPGFVCDFFDSARVVPLEKAASDSFTFDSFSPEVQDAIREAQDELISNLESDARDAIDTIISDGVMSGTDIADVADEIKNMIGLTDVQAKAVLNYQRMLMSLDPSALDSKLRNAEYDAVLQDAIDMDASLSEAAIENMVEDYIDNYLTYRAATIAQTESTRAANEGLHDGYQQAIDRGALTDEAVTRFWQLADAPCPICESIPDNNPEGVGVSEAFDSDDGEVDDPPVHPNCECSVDYVTDLTKVPDDEA